jgi:two-component system sensor histidine kinase KdpD
MFKNLSISPNAYWFSVVITIMVSAICYPFADFIGYRSVALILLFFVSIFSLILPPKPVLLGALLSALIWDFFFIPPFFTFYISNTEDALMLLMYFVIVIVNTVFTSRIKRLQRLSQEREDRVNALKLYDTLFQSISHELRTPIATILGASDSLIENPQITQPNKVQLYQEINGASVRLNNLVSSLLNMSRLDSGSMQPKLDWCDVPDLVNTVINHFDPKQLEYHSIESDFEKGLPLFKLDFGLMEQAIYNIINNAILYTPEQTRILVEVSKANDQCVIAISDTGKGFPKEDIKTVFEKFYRTKGSKTGGLGLGLSISRGFINAHNGTIKVENQTGSGAKFTIQIPAESCYPNDIFDKKMNYE